MNKKDAAEYLGISTRALEGHAQKGHISVRYVKGKTGDVADFDESELRQLKAKLDSQRAPRGAVVTESNESSEGESRSLARLSDVPEAALILRSALESLQAPAMPTVAIADKLTLSLVEAAQLAGLSRGHLREAIEKKKLKARIIGRGWRVKRQDLDDYVRKL
jgi:excisionase family DNA binding protein